MEKEEKVRFILEQMRLGLARKDYIRTQIISKKISKKFFIGESDVVQVSRVKGHMEVHRYTCMYNILEHNVMGHEIYYMAMSFFRS